MQENPNKQPSYDEQEINIIELIAKLWKKRSLIIKWCIAGAIVGLVVGFSIPKTYTASVTFAPEAQQKTNNSVSSIASMMGMNLNNNVDAISIDMFPDVVHSTPFIVDLFDLPVTFERKDSIITTSLLNYMLEYQKIPWWTPIIKFPMKALRWCIDFVTPDKEESASDGTLNPYNLPKNEREVVKFFSKNILVSIDKTSLMTQMSLQMQDPKVVATVMTVITENLKKYMSDYRSSKARQDTENLSVICDERKMEYYRAQQAYANFIDANKNVILQSAQAERDRLQQEMNLAYQVYSQVATNLEGARILEQQSKPVFVIIEPVTIPINITGPNKFKLLLLYTFFAACCVIIWILFGEEYWKEIKDILYR